MRFARALCGVVGALAVTAWGAGAFADAPTLIRLVEVYEVTPGVSGSHEVTLTTDHPLIGEQCQSMGTATKATSSVSVNVDGVDGCRFTWLLEDSGGEVVSVDDGGVFHFHSLSSRLLDGFSSPGVSASIESVTLVAHESVVEEASAGASISTPGTSTKRDASTVTWREVHEDVSASGTVSLGATPHSPAASASPSPSPSLAAAPRLGGRGFSGRTLVPILVVTAAVLFVAFVGSVARRVTVSRRRAADARFERDAALRQAQRASFISAKGSAAPYGHVRAAEGGRPLGAERVTGGERFAPPGGSGEAGL